MKPKTQFLKISDHTIAYYDLGDPKAPAILMGHSFLWDKDMWREQFDALSQHYRLIVPDLWAHGESDQLPSASISIKQLADDHWQLMQTLGIHQFAIIGLSVGGMWATQIALDHPKNITALIIIGTFVGIEPPESKQAYLDLMKQFKTLNGFNKELIEATWPFFYSKKIHHHSSLVTELKNRLSNIEKKNIDDVYTIGEAIFNRESNLENIAKLEMPFAVMVGADDIARVPSESEQMAKAANTKHLYLIKDAGHISALEQPKAVNECLLRFLQSYL